MVCFVSLFTEKERVSISPLKAFHADIVNMPKEGLEKALTILGWKLDEAFTNNCAGSYTVYVRPSHDGTYRCWVK